MKKITLTIIVFLVTLNILAQQQGKREKIKAYKTAYITDHLDLTPKEAEKFWPIYNAHEKEMFQLKVEKNKETRKQIVDKGGVDELSEVEANQILDKLIKNEQAIVKAKKDLYNNLKNVISSKKILKLYKSEHDFNRKLLSEYRKKKMMPQKGRPN